MDCPHWVRYLHAELQRHGLPQAYIDRVVEEMGDHRSDLFQEHAMSEELAASRLGDVEWLARQMADHYPRRTFAGRHPWLAFVVLPAPLLFGVWTLIVAFTLGAAWAVEAFGAPQIDWNPTAAGIASSVGTMAIRFLPPTLVILWLCRAARTSGVSWRLPAVGLTLVALLAFLFQSTLAISPVSGESALSMGLMFGDELLTVVHVSQLIVPLTLAALYLALVRSELRAAPVT